jgi:hypothetical protein
VLGAVIVIRVVSRSRLKIDDLAATADDNLRLVRSPERLTVDEVSLGADGSRRARPSGAVYISPLMHETDSEDHDLSSRVVLSSSSEASTARDRPSI